MTSKDRLFTLIETIRFPLIFLVVIAHMVPFDTPQIEFNLTTESIYIFISELISHHIAKIPVRLFFIISAYFFYFHLKDFDFKLFINNTRKRIKSLLIPYLAWNAITIIAIIAVTSVKNLFYNTSEKHELDLYYSFWGGPINFPLWYVRDLMVITLLSPILFYFLKKTKLLGLIILYIIYFLYHQEIFHALSMKSIFYYAVGMYLAMYQVDVLGIISKYKRIIYAITLFLLLATTLTNGTIYNEYLLRIFLLPGIISLLNITQDISKNTNLKTQLLKLSKTTFFIYVTHEIFIINWIKGFIHRYEFLSTGIGKIISYFIGPVVCIIICISLFRLLEKFLPKLLFILTGQRSTR